MKRNMLLLVAVLWSGELCEAEIMRGESIEDAKTAIMVNYCLPCGAVKEWRVQ